MNRLRSIVFLSLLSCFCGCGAKTQLPGGACDGIGADTLRCVVSSADPCGAPVLVAPECDAAARALRCPAGARAYERVEPASPCLPFSDPAGPIRALEGSLVRIPTDDGRCLWVAEQIETASGESIRNVAFEPDREAPFATCPLEATFSDGAGAVSAVKVDGVADPNIDVQIANAYRFAGETRVVYRLFEHDASSPFGVTFIGGGLARWDASAQRIVVPALDATAFSTDLDLGDAALARPDHAYVWGCPTPMSFVGDCLLARFDNGGAMQIFGGANGWIDGADPADAVIVFQSGPWMSSVVPNTRAGGLIHVFASGFGTTLESHVATAVEGPWVAGSSLGACDLPANDPHSFCAGPIVHEELADPTRPGELVVSYGSNTTASNGVDLKKADPHAYWTRLVWKTAP